MSPEIAAAPALTLETIWPRLAEFCVPNPVCRFRWEDATFQQLELRCQQVVFVKEIDESR
jgi:hypothetical protein